MKVQITDSFVESLKNLTKGRWKYKLRHLYKRVRYQWFSPYKLFAVKDVKVTDYIDMVEFLPRMVFQAFTNFIENEYGFYYKISHPELNLSIEDASYAALDEKIKMYKDSLEDKSDDGFMHGTYKLWVETLSEYKDIYTWIKKGQIDPDEFYEEPTVPSSIDENGNYTNRWVDKEGYVLPTSPEWKEYYAKVRDLEEALDQKKTNMAVRILQLRRGLWT